MIEKKRRAGLRKLFICTGSLYSRVQAGLLGTQSRREPRLWFISKICHRFSIYSYFNFVFLSLIFFLRYKKLADNANTISSSYVVHRLRFRLLIQWQEQDQVAPKPMTSESRIRLLIVNGGHRQLSGQRCASPISIFAAPLAIKVVIMVKKGDKGS